MIVVDDDIVELESKEPINFCAVEEATRTKLAFSGQWAALDGRRRSSRGVDEEARATRFEWD